MLRSFLGEWLYWPIVVMTIGFATVSVFSNVSLAYSEIYDQFKELRRVRKKTDVTN
jgi:hypothetical protein